MTLDLDTVRVHLANAATVVESAADSIDSEWGDGSAYDVREVARFLGGDVYVPDFDGIELPALVAELRAAREVVKATRAVTGEVICSDCWETDAADVDDDACECSCHGKDIAITKALDAYDKTVGEVGS